MYKTRNKGNNFETISKNKTGEKSVSIEPGDDETKKNEKEEMEQRYLYLLVPTPQGGQKLDEYEISYGNMHRLVAIATTKKIAREIAQSAGRCEVSMLPNVRFWIDPLYTKCTKMSIYEPEDGDFSEGVLAACYNTG